MKIKTQILLGYLFLLIIIIILIANSVYFLYLVDKASRRIVTENYISIRAGQNMHSILSQLNDVLSKIADPQKKDKGNLTNFVHSLLESYDKELSTAKDNITEFNENETIRINIEQFHELKKDIDTFCLKGYSEELYFQELIPDLKLSFENSSKLIDLNQNALLIKNSSARDAFQTAWIYLAIIGLFSIISAYFAIVKIPGAITKPIKELTNKIIDITNGNYGKEIETIPTNELGGLISTFNIMSKKIEEYQESNISIISAQKSRIESIVNSFHDGIIVLDENKRFILVNPKASLLLGFTNDAFMEKYAADVSIQNNLVREILKSIDIETESETNEKVVNSFLRISIEGKEEYFLKEIIRVFDTINKDSKKFLGYVIVLKNVTSFKELDDAKTNFIAILSHEIKTPLSAMNMNLSLMLNNKVGALNDTQEKIIFSIKEEIQRLLLIINNLLDISRYEVGHIKLNFQKSDIKFIVNYSLSPFYLQMKEKNINIKQSVSEEIHEINIDPEKISWVLMNLIANAIRYTPKEEEIDINVYRVGNFIQFDVIDSGPGIDPKYHEKIFEKFFQVPGKSSDEDGLGLGLAICKEIVIAHSGKIWVSRNITKGSTFSFILPVNS